MNLPPTGLLTTDFLLGTCFLYKILAPRQSEGEEGIAPLQVNVSSHMAEYKLCIPHNKDFSFER